MFSSPALVLLFAFAVALNYPPCVAGAALSAAGTVGNDPQSGCGSGSDRGFPLSKVSATLMHSRKHGFRRPLPRLLQPSRVDPPPYSPCFPLRPTAAACACAACWRSRWQSAGPPTCTCPAHRPFCRGDGSCSRARTAGNVSSWKSHPPETFPRGCTACRCLGLGSAALRALGKGGEAGLAAAAGVNAPDCEDGRRLLCGVAGGRWQGCRCTWPQGEELVDTRRCPASSNSADGAAARPPFQALNPTASRMAEGGRAPLDKPCCPLRVGERTNSTTLCQAVVWDDAVQARVSIDDTGCIRMHLPPRYEATATVVCESPESGATTRRSIHFTWPADAHEGCSKAGSGFSPGFYHNGKWQRGCRPTVDTCHALARQRTWLRLVGDSFTRELFVMLAGRLRLPWRRWASPSQPTGHYDHALAVSPDGLVITYQALPAAFGAQYSAWLDQVVNATYATTAALRPADAIITGPATLPGPEPDPGTAPASTVFSLGYHHSAMPVDEMRLLLRRLFRAVDPMETPATRLPPWFYLLNVPPMTEMIPDKYAADRRLRTPLACYWKNRAVLQESSAAGIPVLDAYSPTLALNDVSHRDAVHLELAHGMQLGRVVYHAILDGICQDKTD